jgi:hypothetical protein
MVVISLLLLAALVCFILLGLGIPSPPRFQWLGWGLFFWCLWVALGGHALFMSLR